jgi:ribulose kinase
MYPDLPSASIAMKQGGRTRLPDPATRQRLDRDYRIFLEMHAQRKALDALQ